MVRVRKIAGVGATAAVSVGVALTGASAASASPASPASAGAAAVPAQAASGPVSLVGDFVGDGRDEVLNYIAGSGPDIMGSFARAADGTVSMRTTPFQVNGTYRPVAGNFDGDAKDEVLWYGYGTAGDFLWNFTGPTTYTSRSLRIDGQFVPAAGDFDGNGVDDVFWYGPGAAADRIWHFAADGTWRSGTQSVSGTYEPIVGSFGADATDDILWYSVDPAGPDHLWDFTAGTTAHTSRALPVSRAYEPIPLDMWGDGAGGGDIFWYGPGTDPDYRWDFVPGSGIRSAADPVNGRYAPVAAGDFFADGSDDILWFSYTQAAISVWDHTVSGNTLYRTRVRLGFTEVSPPVEPQQRTTTVVATR
jgi:hypothetical protein